MRIASRLIFIIILLFSQSIVFGQDPPKKKNIAVIDLESRGGLSKAEIGTLTDRLRSLLVRTNAFNVIDRGRMQNILDEQGFQMSGCTSTECAVEAGMILGVEEMVSGTIGRIGKLYTIDIILLRVETSRIIKSLTRDYTGEIEGLVPEMKSIANELAGVKVEKVVAAAFGNVMVSTDPSGAEIFIDDKKMGVTPFTVQNVGVGKHNLKLKKKGYTDYVTEINIVQNQTRNISTELKQRFVLSITSTPAGADIYINNRKIGTTPYRGYYADEAELKVELRKENYEPWTEEVTMDEHQTLRAGLESIAQAGQPSEGGGSSTWLWIGAGAVAVGAAAFLLMPQDDGGSDPGTGTQSFPTPPTRP